LSQQHPRNKAVSCECDERKHGIYNAADNKIDKIGCWRAFCDSEIKVKTMNIKAEHGKHLKSGSWQKEGEIYVPDKGSVVPNLRF